MSFSAQDEQNLFNEAMHRTLKKLSEPLPKHSPDTIAVFKLTIKIALKKEVEIEMQARAQENAPLRRYR